MVGDIQQVQVSVLSKPMEGVIEVLPGDKKFIVSKNIFVGAGDALNRIVFVSENVRMWFSETVESLQQRTILTYQEIVSTSSDLAIVTRLAQSGGDQNVEIAMGEFYFSLLSGRFLRDGRMYRCYCRDSANKLRSVGVHYLKGGWYFCACVLSKYADPLRAGTVILSRNGY